LSTAGLSIEGANQGCPCSKRGVEVIEEVGKAAEVEGCYSSHGCMNVNVVTFGIKVPHAGCVKFYYP